MGDMPPNMQGGMTRPDSDVPRRSPCSLPAWFRAIEFRAPIEARATTEDINAPIACRVVVRGALQPDLHSQQLLRILARREGIAPTIAGSGCKGGTWAQFSDRILRGRQREALVHLSAGGLGEASPQGVRSELEGWAGSEACLGDPCNETEQTRCRDRRLRDRDCARWRRCLAIHQTEAVGFQEPARRGASDMDRRQGTSPRCQQKPAFK